MNIEKVTSDITHSIIDHFRNQSYGPGYFYMDQEWAISKIVEKHIKANLPKPIRTSDDPINIGDRVVLVSDGEYAAERCADAVVVEPAYPMPKDMIYLHWNRDNPLVHGQMDGGYYRTSFKKIVNGES